MSYEIKGKLIEKFETVEVTDTFKKREFVLEKEENVGGKIYTETIKFQVTQDKCYVLDGFEVGKEVEVSFNVKGRKWEKEGKVNYFNNLECWKISEAGNSSSQPVVASVSNDNQEDDLPF